MTTENKVEVGISQDEWYPVYIVDARTNEWQDLIVEIPSDLFRNHAKAEQEYCHYQSEIAAIYQKAIRKRLAEREAEEKAEFDRKLETNRVSPL